MSQGLEASMQRYFLELAYNGTRYSGWQRQPHEPSVQESLEIAISMILGAETAITGCGRTDAGVHAQRYFAHFNFRGALPPGFLQRINRLLDADIALYQIFPVHWDAHARFDAYYRSYEYHLSFRKDPFARETAYFFPFRDKPDPGLMQAAAARLLQYADFFPLCKTGHDAKTTLCTLFRSEWEEHPEREALVYHIAANRFLRGMVRLVVGMCIDVGLGRISLAQLDQAFLHRERLPRNLSVPPEGLFLTDVRYPYPLTPL